MVFSSCWFLISEHVCIWKVTVFYVKVFLLENKTFPHYYDLGLSLKLAIFYTSCSSLEFIILSVVENKIDITKLNNFILVKKNENQ